jgi:hypothetical protein
VTDGTAGRCGTVLPAGAGWLLAHLIVRATGPGGTTDKVVGVNHAEPRP